MSRIAVSFGPEVRIEQIELDCSVPQRAEFVPCFIKFAGEAPCRWARALWAGFVLYVLWLGCLGWLYSSRATPREISKFALSR
jgi:hypothetical protein